MTVGKQIHLYPGVKTWFKRMNEYGKELGLEIEHYVISSGMSEIIESVDIAKELKPIYISHASPTAHLIYISVLSEKS